MVEGCKVREECFKPTKRLILVDLTDVPEKIGGLDRTTHEAARVSCCHSGGTCNGSEEGFSARPSGTNNASVQTER